MEINLQMDDRQSQNSTVQKKEWVSPNLMVISTDHVRAGTTPGTKEYDDGLGHLYSS